VSVEAKDDGDGDDNWATGAIAYQSCKAPAKIKLFNNSAVYHLI